MHTPLCDQLGIEFPIFAFTHCRDVVVAVAKRVASASSALWASRPKSSKSS